jgi:3-oxoacyl-(acyl-carrier-protein) synthase III
LNKSARIVDVAGAIPATIRSSNDVETLIAKCSDGFKPRQGVIEAMSGVRERRVAGDSTQCSDLATDACRRVMDKVGIGPGDVDLLIFAAAGQDLIEPATAHIVQSKLGTNCPVFDVKNACNSFLNGVQLAESLIATGANRHVLVTVGEISSRGIAWRSNDLDEFKRNMPGYTMGDAGAAALLGPATNGAGIFYRSFASLSEYWPLTTVLSGGSMNPRGEDHSYIRANSPKLKVAFREIGLPFLKRTLREANVRFDDFDRIFVHQVSLPYLHDMLAESGIPVGKVEITVAELGNMAAATIPVAMARAIERGDVGPGDRVMCLGLASGISIGVLMMDL